MVSIMKKRRTTGRCIPLAVFFLAVMSMYPRIDLRSHDYHDDKDYHDQYDHHDNEYRDLEGGGRGHDYSELYANGLSDPSANFRVLRDLHTDWKDGLFGSRPNARKNLHEFLVKLIRREIKTDHSFYMVSPESLYDSMVHSVFSDEKWLRLKGRVDAESLKKVIEKDPLVLKSWWRSRRLLSVTGRVKDFRIDDRDWTVVLFLDRMRVEEQ
jgi:hypothetical protein